MSWPMVSPLRQRMIDDIRARKLGRHSPRSHIHSCKRFAAFLKPQSLAGSADASEIPGIPGHARVAGLLARSGLRVTAIVDGKVRLFMT